jgi:hypothetical protein
VFPITFLARNHLQHSLSRAGWCDLRAEGLGLCVVRRVVEIALESFVFGAMGGIARNCEHAFAVSEFSGR